MTFARLRRNDLNCGICSNAWTTLSAVLDCMNRGIVPIVDMQHDNYTQFHDGNTVGSINVWEDYFKQPFSVSLDDVVNYNTIDYPYGGCEYIEIASFEEKRIISKIVLNPSHRIQSMIDSFMKGIDVNNTVGVMMRGTDFTSIKPHNHSIPPTVDKITEDIKKLSDTTTINTIFLAADEGRFGEELEKTTGIKTVMLQKHFVPYSKGRYNYDIMRDMDYSSKLNINSEYMSSIFILSNLRYNMLAKTSARFLYNYIRMNKEKPIFEIQYELGEYK